MQYTDYASRFMQFAHSALEKNDRLSFWQYLSAAKQWELAAWSELEAGVSSESPQIRAQQVLLEATEVLPPIRREEVKRLLLTDDGLVKNDLDAEQVYTGTRLIHEKYLDDYTATRRMQRLERQFQSLMITTLLALGGIFAAFREPVQRCTGQLGKNSVVQQELDVCTISNPEFFDLMNVFSLLTTVVLFGILGASVSGLLSLSNVLGKSRIPEHVGSYWLAIGRVVTGAAAALTFTVFLLSGIPTQFLRIDEITPSFMLAVAFISGFSERLLLRTVETALGDSDVVDDV